MPKPASSDKDTKRVARQSKRSWKKPAFALVVILAALLIAFWGYSPKSYMTAGDVTRAPLLYSGKVVEVKGIVDAPLETNGTYKFNLTSGGGTLVVEYSKALPAQFKAGTEVVAKGKVRNGTPVVVLADELTVGCPSKY